jgi:iron complex outermembrane receptor protein
LVFTPLVFAEVPVSPSPADTTPTSAGEVDEGVLMLEEVSVVGSRLESTDVNTPSPVFAMSRAEIDARGYTVLADVVRNLPFNSG